MCHCPVTKGRFGVFVELLTVVILVTMCDHMHLTGSRIVFRDRVEGLALHSGEVIDVLGRVRAYRYRDSYGRVRRHARRDADHGATLMQVGEGGGTRAIAYGHGADGEGTAGTGELVGDRYVNAGSGPRFRTTMVQVDCCPTSMASSGSQTLVTSRSALNERIELLSSNATITGLPPSSCGLLNSMGPSSSEKLTFA